MHTPKRSTGSRTAAGHSDADARDRDLVDGIYPGTCREGLPPGRPARSVRLRVGTAAIEFRDGIQGPTSQNLEAEVGDFVVLRADGVVAYHLAVVVDDAEQRVSEVVRGCDLLESTPRQILIQRALGLPTPAVRTPSPVAVDAGRRKLSKQAPRPADLRGARPARSSSTRSSSSASARRAISPGHRPARSSRGASSAGTAPGFRAVARRRRQVPISSEAAPRTDEACDAFPGSAGILPAAGRRPAVCSCGQDARAPGKGFAKTWLNHKHDGRSRSPAGAQPQPSRKRGGEARRR